MQNLFTIICESCGGIYSKQVVASEVSQALQQWMDWIRDFRELPLLTLEVQSLMPELQELKLAPLQECQNVWSGVAVHASIKLWIYIIKTQAE